MEHDPKSAALGQIADDHEAVREGMERIQSEVARLRDADPTPGDWGALPQLTQQFRQFLKEHFTREERDEFLGLGSPWDPVTRGRIDQLIVQHRNFLAQLQALSSELAEAAPDDARIERVEGEVENLFANIRWHDSVETSLLRRLQFGR